MSHPLDQMKTPAAVFYHADCVDGIYGGEVARIGLELQGYRVTTYPLTYDQSHLPADAREAHKVVFVDICPNASQLAELCEKECVTILDHHASAQAQMESMPAPIEAIYDAEHSGAVMAWHYFFPGQEVPLMLRYVEDRDLWSFALEGSREVGAWMQWCKMVGKPIYEFESWNDPDIPYRMQGWGYEVTRFQHEAVAGAVMRAHFRQVGVFVVPCCAMQFWESEIGEALLREHPNMLVAGNVAITHDGRVRFSVRSRGDVHVGELMKELFGGGGHKAAAGKMFDSLSEFERCCPIVHMSQNTL